MPDLRRAALILTPAARRVHGADAAGWTGRRVSAW